MFAWEAILEEISRTIFGLICHQDPSILMKIGGKEILLCPRCAGLHMGFLYSFVATILLTRKRIRIVEMPTKLILIIALGSIAVDWGVGGYLKLFTPTSLSRFLTGLAGGSALGILVTSYRRGMTLPLSNLTINLNGLHVVGLICLSFFIGIVVVALNSWALISLVLLLSVSTNALIAIHTMALFLRSRLFSGIAVGASSYNKGGSL